MCPERPKAGKERMMTTAERARVEVRHPREPLTAEEIEAAGQILRKDRTLAATARFVYVTLREPAKEAILNYQPGDRIDREAHVVLRERAERRTYEAVVSITAGEVRLWREGAAAPPRPPPPDRHAPPGAAR